MVTGPRQCGDPAAAGGWPIAPRPPKTVGTVVERRRRALHHRAIARSVQ